MAGIEDSGADQYDPSPNCEIRQKPRREQQIVKCRFAAVGKEHEASPLPERSRAQADGRHLRCTGHHLRGSLRVTLEARPCYLLLAIPARPL
jgi:hypothetical protein